MLTYILPKCDFMHSVINYVHKWTMVNIFKQVFNPIFSFMQRNIKSQLTNVTAARQRQLSQLLGNKNSPPYCAFTPPPARASKFALAALPTTL